MTFKTLPSPDRERLERVQSDLLHEQLEHANVLHSCLNCELFDNDKQICLLAGIAPPPKVAARGCPSWTSIIPF